MGIKAFCVHAHFYQPPREDPYTGKIPSEAGAAPYKNWNERIHAECYRPNAELGNFQQISFNIGPTLFAWMAAYDPATYRKILSQDQANVARFGVGNAIAQAYHHTILSLGSTADKIIQTRWGIADFLHRFHRQPQGLWLPETAVDLETLSILARQGIKFVILAPWQCKNGQPDPTEAYRVDLPEGQSITVFFYHGGLSGGISFNPALTSNADEFARGNLEREFRADKDRQGEAQLLMVASDGELYGHHQPFREKFLSHLLDGAGKRAGLTPVFPALWLQEHPPRQKAEIREYTSWSCPHGVARWSSGCDCTPGESGWKLQLRRSLNRLANAIDTVYFEAVYPYVTKPRGLREKYIHVLLGEMTSDELITHMAGQALTGEQYLRINRLLKAQYERQRMFASCGWYFEDFDRIEPKNSLAYAAQAVRLTELATGEDLSSDALVDFKNVVSPRTGLKGDMVFREHLKRT